MTLDEAIKHAEEVADYDCYNENQFKCSEEHRQLAEWLKELKAYREAPSVEPERKTGKWIDDGDGCFKCSKCNTAFCWSSRILASNFCPECGADMRKE